MMVQGKSDSCMEAVYTPAKIATETTLFPPSSLYSHSIIKTPYNPLIFRPLQKSTVTTLQDNDTIQSSPPYDRASVVEEATEPGRIIFC